MRKQFLSILLVFVLLFSCAVPVYGEEPPITPSVTPVPEVPIVPVEPVMITTADGVYEYYIDGIEESVIVKKVNVPVGTTEFTFPSYIDEGYVGYTIETGAMTDATLTRINIQAEGVVLKTGAINCPNVVLLDNPCENFDLNGSPFSLSPSATIAWNAGIYYKQIVTALGYKYDFAEAKKDSVVISGSKAGFATSYNSVTGVMGKLGKTFSRKGLKKLYYLIPVVAAAKGVTFTTSWKFNGKSFKNNSSSTMVSQNLVNGIYAPAVSYPKPGKYTINVKGLNSSGKVLFTKEATVKITK